jgi:hypothetical protein
VKTCFGSGSPLMTACDVTMRRNWRTTRRWLPYTYALQPCAPALDDPRNACDGGWKLASLIMFWSIKEIVDLLD